MQIKASTRSRFLKFAKGKAKEACLTKMVGRIELDATKPDETQFLLALYNVVKGRDWGGKGSVVVLDDGGKEVCTYVITGGPKEGDTGK